MSASNIGCDDEMDWIQIDANLPGRFEPEVRYLVGVSGGRDSVVPVHRLIDLGYRKLIVCHFNHRLRGRETFIHCQARLEAYHRPSAQRPARTTPTR